MNKYLYILSLTFFTSGFSIAQDSTKNVSHEIGFNTVSLVKQLISNNPTETLNQLPYDIFYNIYFKQKIGIRLGMGITTSNSKVEIQGQADPRTTTGNNLHLRGGVSDNFLINRRLTLNAFADILYSKQNSTTINTHTVQNFGDPVEEIQTTTTDDASGIGAQVGVGVKYSVLKNLALYIEVPLTYMNTQQESTVIIRQPFVQENKSNSKSSSSVATVFLPTTIYLVLMF